MTTNAVLLIDSHHGIYIPKFFIDTYRENIINADELKEELEDITHPDNELYNESWDTVLDKARLKAISGKGREYVLHQDQDLWAIPVDEVDQIPE